MSEIEILVEIRDRVNLLLNSNQPAQDMNMICDEIAKIIEDRLTELQKQLNVLS